MFLFLWVILGMGYLKFRLMWLVWFFVMMMCMVLVIVFGFML